MPMKVRHIYVRGNYREDIFFDKIDLTNAWNRIWLTAEATGTQILALELLSNHFHICVRFPKCKEESDESCVTDFIHYLRMSISQYFNRRHRVHGSLGSRRYGKGKVYKSRYDGGTDLRDLICYIHRNVTHHQIASDYQNYRYSTYKCIFGEFEDPQKCFTVANLPVNKARTYLPLRKTLPAGWSMTFDGLIVPPAHLFPREELEKLFYNKEFYEDVSDTVTRREKEGEKNERLLGVVRCKDGRVTDEEVTLFVSENCQVPLLQMDRKERIEAIQFTKESMPGVKVSQLSRVFAVPATTIYYWINRKHS